MSPAVTGADPGVQHPHRWLLQSRRRLFFDMHFPNWPGTGIAEHLEPVKLAVAIAESGADSAVLFAKCQYGSFYTRVAGERLHQGLGDVDFLEETSEALRQRGVRSIAYYSVAWDERFADERPEWLAENASGARGAGPYRWRTLCINGPYAATVERHLAQIAHKPIDGIWLDMTIIGDGNCYCPRCRAAFAERFGREPPTDPADPSFADFHRFHYDVVESFYGRIRARLRAEAPDLAFTNNYWGYPWSSAAMGSRAIGATADVDFVTGEAYSDWTGIRSTAMLPVFLRSVARSGRSPGEARPFEALIGTGVNTWDFTRKPKAYLSYEAFSVFAHGATVCVDDQPLRGGGFDERLYREDLRAVFGEISRADASVRGRHARYAAIFHSQRTKDRCADQREFVKDLCGSFRLLHDLHLPVEFLFDESLDALRDAGPLLVLPGAAHLDSSDWRAVDGFMRRGGLAVASGGLGEDSGVRDALRGLGIEAGDASRFSLSYLRTGDADRDILVRGRASIYRPGPAWSRGRLLGEVVDPVCETGPREFWHNNLPAPGSGTGTSALFDVPVGRGALVLFSQPIFRHYAKESSRPLRDLVKQAILRHLAPPRIELDIPMRMDFSIVEADDALFVHLLNPSMEPPVPCGLMDIYEGAFERSYEYMEEEVPVHDLRIRLRRDRIGPVSTLREGSAVEVRPGTDGWEIRVARVSIWEIVRIALGDGAWLVEEPREWQ